MSTVRAIHILSKRPVTRRRAALNRVVIGIAVMFAGSARGQIACEYEIVATIQGPNCGPIGQRGLIPAAMSPNGLYVTGYHDRCDGIDYDAFIWVGPPPGTRITIPRPPGIIGARGADVNDSGVVVGTCRFTEGGNDRGFVWKYQSAEWITLEPPLPGGQLQPAAISNAGTVVGNRSIRNDNVPREAFIWSQKDGYQGLGVLNGPNSGATGISENGIVVGWTGHDGSPIYNNVRAFIHQEGVTTVLGPVPGGVSSIARAVNSSGQVALGGKTQVSPAQYGGYIYLAGKVSPVVVPSGFDWASIYGICDSGFLAGDCGHFASSDSPASVWEGNHYFVLEGNITPPSVDFSRTNYAASVSLDGRILLVGRTLQNLPVGFLLGPLPSIPGDTNCDEHVNLDDLLNVINSWGNCTECPTDFDQNNLVNIDDLLVVINQWQR